MNVGCFTSASTLIGHIVRGCWYLATILNLESLVAVTVTVTYHFMIKVIFIIVCHNLCVKEIRFQDLLVD